MAARKVHAEAVGGVVVVLEIPLRVLMACFGEIIVVEIYWEIIGRNPYIISEINSH